MLRPVHLAGIVGVPAATSGGTWEDRIGNEPTRRRVRAEPVSHNPEVDAWFAERGHPLEEAMHAARDIILGADARVSESVKWKTPTFDYRGNIVSFNPSKRLVSLMFHRGSEIPGDHPRLEGDGKLVRTMRFATADEVRSARADLEAVIRAWCDSRARR